MRQNFHSTAACDTLETIHPSRKSYLSCGIQSNSSQEANTLFMAQPLFYTTLAVGSYVAFSFLKCSQHSRVNRLGGL